MRVIALPKPSVDGDALKARWGRPFALGLLVLNFVLIAKLLSWPDWRTSPDWTLWAHLPASPYAEPLYRYSPVAAWLIHPVAALVGPIGFMLLHFALLLALPRKIGLIVAISFPFWIDMLWGNVFTLVFVAAFCAVRGNRWGVLGYAVLTLLMPRPVQLPLLAWLLWQHGWLRLPFVGLFALHLAVVVATGLGGEWLSRLLQSSANEMAFAYNFGPTRFFGYAWFVVGIPLALYVFRKHPAWAGLALSPYLLGQYWLMVLADRVLDRSRQAAPREGNFSGDIHGH